MKIIVTHTRGESYEHEIETLQDLIALYHKEDEWLILKLSGHGYDVPEIEVYNDYRE